MRNILITSCMSLLAVLFFTYIPSYADMVNGGDEEIADLELFYASEDLIYSVSKRAEHFMGAPSAVYTITAEDIKYSGAKKITDVFRMVPGVDVTDVNCFYSGVQARGFSFFPKFSRQMLVLIDGRTVYSPQINATFWDQIPLFLENIERIEVVRGPNAALYGANAFNGVINIITRNPDDTQGALLSVTAGNRESQWEVVRYGDKVGKLSFRATAGYHETVGFSKVDDTVRKPQATLRAEYKLTDRSTLSLHGGFAGGDRELAKDLDPEVTSLYLMGRYETAIGERNRLSVQYYHDYRNAALTFGVKDKYREHDVEVQFNRDTDLYHLVSGVGYRVDEVRHGFMSGVNKREFKQKGARHLPLETRYNHIFKAFVNTTLNISESLKFTAALMLENNDFVGTMLSPKAALVYLPGDKHSFRLSVSRAYRTPSFIEEYADITLPAPFPPFYIGQKHGIHLDPERIVAFECGYRGRYSGDRLSLNVELFYHDIDDIIIYHDEKVRSIYQYENYVNNHVRGLEVSGIWKITDWWRMTMAYSYQEASDAYLKGLIIEQKYNVGCRFTMPYGVVANFQLYYVDQFHFEKEAWVPASTVKDYMRLDVRISKTFFNETAEIALIGQNLLDPRHYEYPLALSAGEANRTFYIELSYRFGK